jgi:signal peptidase I
VEQAVETGFWAKIKMKDPVFSVSFSGYSMYPFLINGDTLLYKKINVNDLSLGDIVLAHKKTIKKTIAHRVISTRPLSTKGDNLTFYDDLSDSVIKGKVFAVKRQDQILTLSRLSSKVIAFFSKVNLTPGIIKSRLLGKPLKTLFSKINISR